MTQMEHALKGTITPQMEAAARHDNVNPEYLRNLVAAGLAVIPHNINRNFNARAVGQGLPAKVNANIGTSEDCCSFATELEKLDMAVKYGADSVMDLSTGGDLHVILAKVLEVSPIMVGTVPLYGVAATLLAQEREPLSFTADSLLGEIENQARMGVDFVTVHTGICRRSLEFLANTPRQLGVVSRGGSVTKAWMKEHEADNPLYDRFDDLLEIAHSYDVTLSLGDSLRPGCQDDAGDQAQMAELMIIGEQVQKARRAGVQCMVEGPGHVPLNEVAYQVQMQKKVCGNAPFYVLGPLVVDVACPYDHIAGAIGGANAVMAGADFLCYVTPAEHLCLPNAIDVREGVIASRIAALAGDRAKGLTQIVERDREMTRARREFDWEAMFKVSVAGDLARQKYESVPGKQKDQCSMCGRLCAVKRDQNK